MDGYYDKTLSWLTRLGEGLLRLLYPPRCGVCGKLPSNLLCEECIAFMKPIVPPLCWRCGKPFPALAKAAPDCAECRRGRYHFDTCRSAMSFEGAARQAVHALKYHGKKPIAETMGELLFSALQAHPSNPPTLQPSNLPTLPTPLDLSTVDLVIPVPLHRRQLWKRGYNQAALLGAVLARRLGVPQEQRALVRLRHTRPQVGLGKKERQENVRGAFFLSRPELVSGKVVLLVDDVFTTGATVNECARTMRRGKPKAIYCATFARVVED